MVYPGLQFISWVFRVVGYLLIAASVIIFLSNYTTVLNNVIAEMQSNPKIADETWFVIGMAVIKSSYAFGVMVSGALSGLCLAALGEFFKVFVDIALNTRSLPRIEQLLSVVAERLGRLGRE